MGVTLGRHLGKEIADALGLKHTRNIRITIPYDDFVMVEVEALLDTEAGRGIVPILTNRRYRLELIDEDEPVDLRTGSVVETTCHGDHIRQYQAVVE